MIEVLAGPDFTTLDEVSDYVRRLIPLEPSAIDRLAGLVDAEAQARVAHIDWVRDRAKNLKPLRDDFMGKITSSNL